MIFHSRQTWIVRSEHVKRFVKEALGKPTMPESGIPSLDGYSSRCVKADVGKEIDGSMVEIELHYEHLELKT